MRRAGVWSSTRSSALRTIGEALHRASTTRGGNRRVGRRRPGRKGGHQRSRRHRTHIPDHAGPKRPPRAQRRCGAAPCGGADQRRRVRDGARRRRLRRRAADRARRPRAVGVRRSATTPTSSISRNAGTPPQTGAMPRSTRAPAPRSRPLPTIRAGDPRMGWRAPRQAKAAGARLRRP